ncbi:MAG: RnfABCDGE type electron transport complex subunit D [Oscillospiraceae bacterium]|nr:RnfABCDGE type electron transport complex subunit D [Oscillospiraceae bacterium]
MSNFIVTTSPHLRAKTDTASIMRDVVIALVPALIAAVILFGFRALLVTVVSVVFAVLTEFVYEKACKLPVTVGDWSAVVTGVLLAYNLPVSIPLWQAAFGSIVAILVVKQLFGGLGRNFANPAIVGRIVLFLSFSKTMTAWTAPKFAVDAVSTATPLAIMGNGGEVPSLLHMFLGVKGGCLGEVSALALLIGFVYLLVRKVITWHTPVVFVATVFVLSFLVGGFDAMYALNQILAGGLMLGAIFMATDYATTPSTSSGRVIFGLGCGILTVMIRQWGSYAEGVSFAILFMNILTPYVSKWTRTKPFGGVKA